MGSELLGYTDWVWLWVDGSLLCQTVVTLKRETQGRGTGIGDGVSAFPKLIKSEGGADPTRDGDAFSHSFSVQSP